MGRGKMILLRSDATFQTFIFAYQLSWSGRGETCCRSKSTCWETLSRRPHLFMWRKETPCSSQQNEQTKQVHSSLICRWFISCVIIGFYHYRDFCQVKHKSSAFYSFALYVVLYQKMNHMGVWGKNGLKEKEDTPIDKFCIHKMVTEKILPNLQTELQ